MRTAAWIALLVLGILLVLGFTVASVIFGVACIIGALKVRADGR